MKKHGKSPEEGPCDRKEAGSMAASSVAQYFKSKDWKIVSFFPNSVCRKKDSSKKDEKAK